MVAVAPALLPRLTVLLLATAENGRKPVLGGGGGSGPLAAGCAENRMLLLEVAVLLLVLVVLVVPERNRTLKKTRQLSRTRQKFSSCCYQARKQIYNNQPRFIPLK